jgi:hypothetical protein
MSGSRANYAKELAAKDKRTKNPLNGRHASLNDLRVSVDIGERYTLASTWANPQRLAIIAKLRKKDKSACQQLTMQAAQFH